MSIKRSGLTKPVYVVCVKALQQGSIIINKGDKFELVHDIGSMYVLKSAEGVELIVPKDSFLDVDGDA